MGLFELRRYVMAPGGADRLAALFRKALARGQTGLGMALWGPYRDLDDPEAFVWLRGFSDPWSRLQALTGFYGGPVWARHRAAANATMLAHDNSVLLSPLEGPIEPLAGSGGLGVAIEPLESNAVGGQLERLRDQCHGQGRYLGALVSHTDHLPFAPLPVRAHPVLVALVAVDASKPASPRPAVGEWLNLAAIIPAADAGP